MISIDNKAKHEWERDNFMKWIKSEVQLPNDKGWIEKKKSIKKRIQNLARVSMPRLGCKVKITPYKRNWVKQ